MSPAQSLIDALIDRDPSGRGWLPALLAATPRGRAALGELLDDPGGLEIALAVRGVNGRRATFDYIVPPPRQLLAWFIDHPGELERPENAEVSPETATLRRALLNDDPPGSRARAQDRARERLAAAPPLVADWWRFEDVTKPDAVLATDRLVIMIEGAEQEQRVEPITWYPARSRLIRVAEAARQLAHARRWGTIVITDGTPTQPGDDTFAQTLERGAPHLTASERDELAASYLGAITVPEATAAVALDSPE
jgi:hypothetical protein